MHISLDPPTAAEFAALYAETGWGAWPPETFERALSGTWAICTARDDDGVLVGMGRLISDGALHAFVTEMIVAERARGAGIGAAIVRCLVEEAHRRGVHDVQLFAARGRAGFYERNGFVRRPTDGPGMDLALPASREPAGSGERNSCENGVVPPLGARRGRHRPKHRSLAHGIRASSADTTTPRGSRIVYDRRVRRTKPCVAARKRGT